MPALSRGRPGGRFARLLIAALLAPVPHFLPLLYLPLCATSATATSTVATSIPDLVRVSPLIVHGTVLSAESHWNDDHSLIVTDVRIRVQDTLRGKPVSEVVVTQPGGRAGKLRVDVDGAAAFRPGDETVLFLSRGSDGRFVIAGLSQGRFDVRRDPRTGDRVVAGVSLLPATARGTNVTDPSSVSVPPDTVGTSARSGLTPGSPAKAPGGLSPLDTFLGDIRALVRDLESGGKP